MKDTLISFECAKLAKEKGFNEECYALYQKILIEGEKNDNTINVKGIYSAPTQSLLQKWLRDIHNIHIFIGYRPNKNKWDSHAYDMNIKYTDYMKERSFTKFKTEPLFNTYEEALEQGLIKALKMIKI